MACLVAGGDEAWRTDVKFDVRSWFHNGNNHARYVSFSPEHPSLRVPAVLACYSCWQPDVSRYYSAFLERSFRGDPNAVPSTSSSLLLMSNLTALEHNSQPIYVREWRPDVSELNVPEEQYEVRVSLRVKTGWSARTKVFHQSDHWIILLLIVPTLLTSLSARKFPGETLHKKGKLC